MKAFKVLAAVLVVALVTVPALAQNSQKQGNRKGKKQNAVTLNPVAQAMVRIESLHAAAKKLDLTEAQQESMKKIHESVAPKMEEVMKKIAEVLGPEAMKKASEVAEKAKEEGKNPRQVAMAVESALKLTEEQLKKLEPIGEELTAATRKLTKEINGVLTPEQQEKLKAEMAPRGGRGKKKQS